MFAQSELKPRADQDIVYLWVLSSPPFVYTVPPLKGQKITDLEVLNIGFFYLYQ